MSGTPKRRAILLCPGMGSIIPAATPSGSGSTASEAFELHLAQEVVEKSEIVRLRDQFGHQRLRERKYTPGQIDRRWTDDIETDFKAWVAERRDKLTPFQRQQVLKEN